MIKNSQKSIDKTYFKAHHKLFLVVAMVLVVIFTICIFSYASLFDVDVEEIESINEIKEKTITDYKQCSNLSLEETSYCLRDFVKEFYKYDNEWNSPVKTLEELKEDGGICQDYARFYIKWAKELGFNGAIAQSGWVYQIKPSHAWAIIWGDERYCELDQLEEIKCKRIGQ